MKPDLDPKQNPCIVHFESVAKNGANVIQRVILASSFFGTRQGVGRNHFRPSELLVGTTSDQAGCRSEPLPARQGAGRNHFRPGRVLVGTPSDLVGFLRALCVVGSGSDRHPAWSEVVPTSTSPSRKWFLFLSFLMFLLASVVQGRAVGSKIMSLPTKEFLPQPYE